MSQTCEDIRPVLFDYAVGEVDEPRRGEIEGHLDSCSDCRKRLREIEGTGVALQRVQAFGDIEATEEFQSSTRRLARVESQKRVAISIQRGTGREARRISERVPAAGTKPGAKLLIAAAVIGVVIVALVALERLRAPGDDAPIGDSVARLEASAGKVEVFFRRASQAWSELAPGDRIFAGESVRTGDDAVARLKVTGNRTLWLGPRTRAAFMETVSTTGVALMLERGAVVIASHDGPFRIEAEFGTIQCARGAVGVTSGDDWLLEVFEGTARVESLGVTDIAAGRAASIGGDGAVDLGEVDLAKASQWRFRLLEAPLLARLFEGPARMLSDGRAFVEYPAGAIGDNGRLGEGESARLRGVYAGGVSFNVEVDEWQPGRLAVGFADASAVKLEYIPGAEGANLVHYSSGDRMVKGTGEPISAGVATRVSIRVERAGRDFNVYLAGRPSGSFETDCSGTLTPVLRAVGGKVVVRSATVSGRPAEAWVGETLGTVVPGR